MNACAAVAFVSMCSIIGRWYVRAAARIGGHAAGVGQGAQPPPSKPHPAHGVGALPGEPPANSRPSGNRSAHAPVEQRGRSPAPRPLKAGGQPGRCPASSRSRSGGANSAPQGKHCAGCPPAGTAVRCKGAGGAVLKGDEGVQPERQRVALATAELPCPVDLRLKRLLLPSASGRRSARRSHPTVMLSVMGQASACWVCKCLGRGGNASAPVSASAMGASSASGTHTTSRRPWARVAASILSGHTQTAE